MQSRKNSLTPGSSHKNLSKMRKFNLFFLALITAFAVTSCDSDDDDNGEPDDKNNDDNLEVRDSYNWQDANYGGQLARIELLDLLGQEMAKANNGNASAQQLKDIFNNNGVIEPSDKDLSGKTYNESVQDVWNRQDIVKWFDTLAKANPNGNSGDTVVDGKYYTAQGIEPAQFVEKGLMGACFYYQATSVYLNELGTDNNQNPQEGEEATDMEHHFDEAFGYLGVPENFHENEADEVAGDYKNSAWFWGHYILSRNSELNIKSDFFNAFLRGRSAITQEFPDERDQAVKDIKEHWELLVAANVAHYINSTLSDDNKFSRWHHWSEAKAFHMSFYYNIDKQITEEEWNNVNDLLGETPSEATSSDLQEANEILDGVYDFPTDIKNL